MKLYLRVLVVGWAVCPWGAYAQAVAPAGNPLDSLPQTPAVAPPPKPQVQITPPQQSADFLAQTVVPRQFDIVGVRSVPFDSVAKVFAPLAGQPVTLARIVETGTEITRIYQQAGYALSFAFVPPQDFRNGVVKVTVVEGHIAQLRIEGQAGKSEALLRELAEPLLAEKPLRSETFHRQTQLMARIPGVRVTASAQLPTTTDGATTLVLASTHQPVSVSLGADLRQGHSKAMATVLANDLLGAGSQLTATSLLRPWDEERFLAVGYRQWLNRQGSMLRVNASEYRQTVQDGPGLVGIDDLTQQRRIDVSVQHPLRLDQRTVLMAAAGIYGLNYQRGFTERASGAQLVTQEHVRALYAQLDWTSAQERTVRNASLMLVHGLNALGADTERSTNFGVEPAPNPAKLAFWRLAWDAGLRSNKASGVGAAVSFGGQYSPDILPIAERISFGGSRFGRGYQAGEVTGDSGIGAAVELNYSWPVQQKWLKQAQPYVLYEAARTRQEQRGVPSASLRSASVGVRLNNQRYYSADFALAKPLGDPAFNNPDRKLRVSVLLSYQLD